MNPLMVLLLELAQMQRKIMNLLSRVHAANWWLHVKGWPGSHVVVSYDGDFLPKETKKDAAVLAVHYSQASGQKQVIVDLIRVQYVHPLNTHGSVELTRDPTELTVFINKEKSRLDRLK